MATCPLCPVIMFMFMFILIKRCFLLATMSKQHCRMLQVERFFRQIRMLLRLAYKAPWKLTRAYSRLLYSAHGRVAERRTTNFTLCYIVRVTSFVYLQINRLFINSTRRFPVCLYFCGKSVRRLDNTTSPMYSRSPFPHSL